MLWPTLLDESSDQQMPAHVEALLLSLGEEELVQLHSEGDLVVLLLYVLMIESGFEPADADISEGQQLESPGFSLRRLNSYRRMPRNWRPKSSGGLYELNFLLPPFAQYRCRFVALPSPDALIVNLLVPEADVKGRCICLHPPRYVVGLPGGVSRARFRHLKELSLRFKNSVASPVRCTILQREGVLHASLVGLPPEVALRILALLRARDVLNVAATCREMRHLAADQTVWRYLLQRDFNEQEAPAEEQPCWREKYKERYLRNRRRAMQQRQCELGGLPVAVVTPHQARMFAGLAMHMQHMAASQM